MCLRLLQKHGHKPIVVLVEELLELVILQVKTKQEKFLTEKEIDKKYQEY